VADPHNASTDSAGSIGGFLLRSLKKSDINELQDTPRPASERDAHGDPCQFGFAGPLMVSWPSDRAVI